jgi:hypothetical protein
MHFFFWGKASSILSSPRTIRRKWSLNWNEAGRQQNEAGYTIGSNIHSYISQVCINLEYSFDIDITPSSVMVYGICFFKECKFQNEKAESLIIVLNLNSDANKRLGLPLLMNETRGNSKRESW